MYLGYRTIQLWCCVGFFGIVFVVAGKWFWREIGSFFVVVGKFYYDRKKKVPVVCLAGCAVVSVFGSGDYGRKKKSYSRLSGGLCCCVSFPFWRLRPEKKKLQSSVWRVVLLI